MLTLTEWNHALSEAATGLLEKSYLDSPPVDALNIAKALGLAVAMDRTQAGRGRIKRIAGRSVIFLRPDDRPERLQWAAAHELGESLVWQVCRMLGLDGGDLSPRQREELANQLAKELLLPRQWFFRDCQRFRNDLTRLKSVYRTASHELIAWRWLDRETPAIVTLFDQGNLARRQGNGPARTPALTDVERCCWEQLRRTRQPSRAADRRLEVHGWCVDSPDWQREILYAVLQSPGDDAPWDEDSA